MKQGNKTALAKTLKVSRSSLYYVSKKEASDWQLKTAIETILRTRGKAGYGSRRLAIELQVNRKRVRRVMGKYGIKPYRRRGRKWRKQTRKQVVYPNLLRTTIPVFPHHVWAADFTELRYRSVVVYVATVMDLYTRRIVGIAVSLRRGAPLTLEALYHALFHHPRPAVFHSDNGSEYEAAVFVQTLTELHVAISRSAPGCPWENGYQESFYDKFKVDLGDPNRFDSLGMLVAEVYRTIWDYNTVRIHSALRMSPRVFTRQYEQAMLETSIK